MPNINANFQTKTPTVSVVDGPEGTFVNTPGSSVSITEDRTVVQTSLEDSFEPAQQKPDRKPKPAAQPAPHNVDNSTTTTNNTSNVDNSTTTTNNTTNTDNSTATTNNTSNVDNSVTTTNTTNNVDNSTSNVTNASNTQSAAGNGNVQINGNNNVVNNIHITINNAPAINNVISAAPTPAPTMPTAPAAVQPPKMDLSAAPAGKGLTKIDANTYKTAGGYTIKAEGKDAAWSITGPDGKQLARVWGDPHVQEGDGTKWDFTKDSDFVLPDGTRIMVDTTAETGKSVTHGLSIVNGEDRVEITDIDKNSPKSSEFTDGYEFRAQHAAGQQVDTFYLTHGEVEGSKESVQFVRERDGKIDGAVTGADYVKNKDGSYYEQKVDANAVMLPMERPAVGSPAWGNYVRNFMTDLAAQNYQGMGEYGQQAATYLGQEFHLNHMAGEVTAINDKIDAAIANQPERVSDYMSDNNNVSTDKSNTVGSDLFGGLAALFGGNFGGVFAVLQALGSLFGSNNSLDLSQLFNSQIWG